MILYQILMRQSTIPNCISSARSHLKSIVMNKILIKMLFAFLLLSGIVACEDKKEPYEDFLGTWKLNQVTINDQVQNYSECELKAQLIFEEYNLCKHYDACIDTLINDSWSFTGNTLNINSLLPVSFEVESVSNTALSLKSYDFDNAGEVRVTQYEYVNISE